MSNTSLTTMIMGTLVTLVPSDPTNDKKGRIGSVAVAFDDGTRKLVRAYGRLKDYPTRAEKADFEKELRKFVALPEVILHLFGTKVPAQSRRFNPSEALVLRGYRTEAVQVRAI